MKIIKLVKIRIQELGKLTESKQNPAQILDESNDQKQSEVVNLKKSILKSAKLCASKFENQHKRGYFTNYCIRKANKIIQDEPLPNQEQISLMQKVVDVYDQMYYNVKSGNQNFNEDHNNWEYLSWMDKLI